MKELLIIIPAYNEEENIEKVFKDLDRLEIIKYADILVMNDASTDSTDYIVKDYGHNLVTHVFHMGYGCGLQIGYKYAVRNHYEYVIQIDADGQHDVCNIPVIYKKLKQKNEEGRYPDIVLGSRFMEGSKPYPISALKKFAHAIFRFMIKAGCSKRISDPTSGLQGLNRRAFLYYSQYGHFDDQYPDANMLLNMMLLGYDVEEVPAVMHQRTAGKGMHSGLKPVWYMLRMFFSVMVVFFRCKVLKMDEEIVIKNDAKFKLKKRKENDKILQSTAGGKQ